MSQEPTSSRRKTPAGTATRSFGAGNRENHDATAFYSRNLPDAVESEDTELGTNEVVDRIYVHSAEDMTELADNSVALMMTSPPYHVGKEYDTELSFDDYLALLRRVFTETHRVLEPGGRAVVNVANLGRRPYLSLSSRIVLMMEEIGFLMRGEVIWRKAKRPGGRPHGDRGSRPRIPSSATCTSTCCASRRAASNAFAKARARSSATSSWKRPCRSGTSRPSRRHASDTRPPSPSHCPSASSSSTPTPTTSCSIRSWVGKHGRGRRPDRTPLRGIRNQRGVRGGSARARGEHDEGGRDMKAVVCAPKGKVKLAEVPDPQIQEGTDAVVQVRKTAICGSDLHLLDGSTPGMREGAVIGHELVGLITDLGDDVEKHFEGTGARVVPDRMWKVLRVPGLALQLLRQQKGPGTRHTRRRSGRRASRVGPCAERRPQPEDARWGAVRPQR